MIKITNSLGEPLTISEVAVNDYYGQGVVKYNDKKIIANSVGGVYLEIYVDGIPVERELPLQVISQNLPNKLNFIVGGTYKSIKVTNSSNQPLPNVKFVSNNANIAEVTSDGTVTANSTGSTTIEVYTGDNFSIAKIPIDVFGCKKDDTLCRPNKNGIGYPQQEKCNENGTWDVKEICENGCNSNGKECFYDCNKNNCGKCKKQEDCMNQVDYVGKEKSMTRPCAWTGTKENGSCGSNPINGECSYTKKYECTQGEFRKNSSKETTTRYQWICDGLYGGSLILCTLPKPGTCDGYKPGSTKCIGKGDNIKLKRCQENGQWQEVECLGTCQQVRENGDSTESYATCLSNYCGNFDQGSTQCVERDKQIYIQTCMNAQWDKTGEILCLGKCTNKKLDQTNPHHQEVECDNRYNPTYVCNNDLSISSDISKVNTKEICRNGSEYKGGTLTEIKSTFENGYEGREEDSPVDKWQWTCKVDKKVDVACEIANLNASTCSKDNCIKCTDQSACENKNFKDACDWNSKVGCVSMKCNNKGSTICLYGRLYTCNQSNLLKIKNDSQCCSLTTSNKYNDIVTSQYYTVKRTTSNSGRNSYCNKKDNNKLYSCTWGSKLEKAKDYGDWEILDCSAQGKVCSQIEVNKAKCVDKPATTTETTGKSSNVSLPATAVDVCATNGNWSFQCLTAKAKSLLNL